MKAILIAIALLGALVGLWAYFEGPLRDPEDAVGDFLQAQGRAEDQLTDPLVLAGPRVRPLVVSAVSDRKMKLRRYALAYLGCTRYAPAEATLRQIASDETELDYYRADALEALWRIDAVQGRALALSLQSRSNLVGDRATQLVSSGPVGACRSWFAALTRQHD